MVICILKIQHESSTGVQEECVDKIAQTSKSHSLVQNTSCSNPRVHLFTSRTQWDQEMQSLLSGYYLHFKLFASLSEDKFPLSFIPSSRAQASLAIHRFTPQEVSRGNPRGFELLYPRSCFKCLHVYLHLQPRDISLCVYRAYSIPPDATATERR